MIFLFSYLFWDAIRSEHFTVFYPPELRKEAEWTISCLEHYKPMVDSLTGNSPKHVPVVIEDAGIVPNGFASPINPQIHLLPHPPSPFILTSTPDWWKLVSVHEYTHISHLTHTAGLSSLQRFLWGDLFQPNMYSPGWVVEGITVYAESRISPYAGRLNDGYLDAVVLAQAREGKITSPVRAASDASDFPLERIYFYGGSFMRWISEVYGEESFSRFFGNYAWNPLVPGIGNLIPLLGIDLASIFTYGHTLDMLYNIWKREMMFKARKEKFPQGKLTEKGMYRELASLSPWGICYVRRYCKKRGPFDVARITEVVLFDPHTCKEEALYRTVGWVISRPVIHDGKLYVLEGELGRGFENRSFLGFGVKAVLVEKEIGGPERIIARGPYVSFTFYKDTLFLATRHAIYRYGDEEPWYAGGLEIGEIREGKDGILMVARMPGENWDIYRISHGESELLICSSRPDVDPFYHDGYIYFSSTSGRYNIYRLDPDGEIEKITDYVYARDPVILDGELYFFSPQGDGIHLFRETPEVKGKASLEMMEAEKMVGKPYFRNASPLLEDALTLFPWLRLWMVLSSMEGGILPFVFLSGSDVLLTNGYALVILPDTIPGKNVVGFGYINTMLAPFVFEYYGFYRGGNYTYRTGGEYPLRISMRNGLSSLWVRAYFSSPDTVKGNLFFAWNYPSLSFYLIPEYTWFLKEGKGRAEMHIGGRKWLGNLKVFAHAWGGDDETWGGRCGISIPLPVKLGLWNPNVYFEDMFFALFGGVEGMERDIRERYAGARLVLETKFSFGQFGILPGIEFLWENGKLSWRFTLEGDE